MDTKNCASCGLAQDVNSNFCSDCGVNFRRDKMLTKLYFTYVFSLIIGALSSIGAIQLQSILQNFPLFYCVGLVSFFSYLLLRAFIKKDSNNGIKDIMAIASTSGIFYILTCWVMVFIAPVQPGNMINVLINGFFIGSAHISIYIFSNLFFVLGYKVYILLTPNKIVNQHNIGKTLETAETILEVSTPKGFIKHLRQQVQNKDENNM